MKQEIRVGQAEVRLVQDNSYPIELKRLFQQARERIWCSIFLIELDPLYDSDFSVPLVLRQLAAASWRGVDVRLLIGGSRSNLLIAEAVTTATLIARHLRIPTRGFGKVGQRGSHIKLVVADDWILTGSHNWSPGAFSDNIQDSVAVHNKDLAAYLSNVFLDQWRRAEKFEVQS